MGKFYYYLKSGCCSLLLFLLLLSFLSCNNDKAGYEIKIIDSVSVVKNNNYPNDKKFAIVPLFKYKINFDNNISALENGLNCYFTTDTKNNLYAFHSNSMTIKKYNKSGDQILEFAGRGNGPGELGDNFFDFGAMKIENDILYIFLPYKKQIYTYDLEGNFLKSTLCCIIKNYKDDFRIASSSISPIDTSLVVLQISYGNKEIHRNELNIVQIYKNLSEYNEITSCNYKKTTDYLSFMLAKYAYKSGKIYIAQNSKENFQIDIYDTSANKIQTIRKAYMRTKYPLIFRMSMGLKYQQSILDLQVDKYNRIWVLSAEDNDMSKIPNNNIYQVFSDDGIYLNKIKLDLHILIQNILFLDDIMLIYGLEKENEDSFPSIYVYDY